jgi:phosphate transport system substrate-binding protein
MRFGRGGVLPALGFAVCALCIIGLSGCGGGGTPAPGGEGGRLNGGGSSFIALLFDKKWIKSYHDKTKVELDYASMGSSAGIGKMINGDVDFGATDAPMTADEIKSAGGEDAVVHVPLVMGAVAVIYNLDEVKDLKLTGDVIARIYLGEIKTWDDPALKDLNPGVTLPSQPIKPVYRADGSGTSFIFSDFLSQASPEWSSKVGKKTQLKPPSGEGVQKTPALAQAVKSSKGAIGYVELLYALQNPAELKTAHIQNADKTDFLPPTLEGVTAAAETGLKKVPAEDLKTLRFSIVAAPGKTAYPISGTTWAVLKVKQPAAKAKLLKDFLTWATHDGQKLVSELHYAPLPANVVTEGEKKIQQIGEK